MDHLRRPAARPARIVARLDQRDRQPAHRRIARDPRAGDSAADHREVERPRFELGKDRAPPPRIERGIGHAATIPSNSAASADPAR